MSDGLWWRKLKRGIIRDDHLERVAYSLAPELRPQVLSWYVVAYMLADDNGVFDFEDGGIFALRCFSTMDAVNQIKDEMEKRGVITNVIGGHSSFYMLNDWIEVEDSQFKSRTKITADQRRARVAEQIKQERAEKEAAEVSAKNARRDISAIKRGNYSEKDFTAEAPQVEFDAIPPDVLAARALNFFAQNDNTTKSGEMSKHPQDSTETVQGQYRDSTETVQDSTAQRQEDTETKKHKDIKLSGAVAPELPPAVAAGNINEKSDINYIEETPEKVRLSHYDQILTGITNYFVKNTEKLEEKQKLDEVCKIKDITDKLIPMVDKNNSGAIIVDIVTSVLDKSFAKYKQILPSDLLKNEVWDYCIKKTKDILTLNCDEKDSG